MMFNQSLLSLRVRCEQFAYSKLLNRQTVPNKCKDVDFHESYHLCEIEYRHDFFKNGLEKNLRAKKSSIRSFGNLKAMKSSYLFESLWNLQFCSFSLLKIKTDCTM